MATSKAKRSIHLAQPARRRPNQPSAELMPVKAHVYQAIAELNVGLEKAIVNLQTLQQINFFRSSGLTAMYGTLCEIRASANRRIMLVVNERETANTSHFQQIYKRSKNP
jgi:hypothetical protein